jgi:hypothetical protein
MYMRYLGGWVGHYQVNIPSEEDPAPQAEDEPEEDSDRDELQSTDDPEIRPAPVDTPPQTPEPEDRPASSLSQHSDLSDTPSGTSSDDEPAPGLDGDGDGDGDDDEWEDEPDLGVKDGEGFVEDKVEEGYAAL